MGIGPERSSDHRRRADLAHQFAVVTGAALLYFLVRGVTQGDVGRAEANARRVLRIEDWLGIDLEGWVQSVVLDHGPIVTLSNWVYIWGHWPVIIVTLYGLHRWRPAEFRLLRNALFVSGAIGLVIYVSLPVAPPRLLDGQYRDTVTELSSSYRVLQPPALVNKYAAMPSLHAGWNLLAGLALYRASRRTLLRCLAVVGPVAMAFAVVATANHYVLDVVVGELLATIGWFVALWWSRRSMLRRPREDGGASQTTDVRSPSPPSGSTGPFPGRPSRATSGARCDDDGGSCPADERP